MITLPKSLVHKKNLLFLYGVYEPRKRLPFYIGCGDEGRAEYHWKTFLSTSKHFNDGVQEIFVDLRKCKTEPTVKVLAVYDCEESADLIERNAIRVYGRRIDGGCLCNIMPGGSRSNRGAQRDENTNVKRSETLKTFNASNPEVRRKVANERKGCSYSDVTLERMSEAAKLRCSIPESRKEWLKATQSDEVKQKRVNSYMKWWNSLTEEQQADHRRKSGARKNSKLLTNLKE